MTFYKTLKDYVFEYISEQIHSGAIKPNEKINENSICEVLKISRTPVREALIQLADEGILEKTPRKGFTVKEIDLNKVKEIYSIIGVLEGMSAALSVTKISESDIAIMKRLVEDMDNYIINHDFKNYYKAQLRFHEVFIQPCGNSELINLIQILKMKFIRRSYVIDENNTQLPTALLETNEQHKKIYELFLNRDSKGIEDYLRNVHWNVTYAHYDSLT